MTVSGLTISQNHCPLKMNGEPCRPNLCGIGRYISPSKSGGMMTEHLTLMVLTALCLLDMTSGDLSGANRCLPVRRDVVRRHT